MGERVPEISGLEALILAELKRLLPRDQRMPDEEGLRVRIRSVLLAPELSAEEAGLVAAGAVESRSVLDLLIEQRVNRALSNLLEELGPKGHELRPPQLFVVRGQGTRDGSPEQSLACQGLAESLGLSAHALSPDTGPGNAGGAVPGGGVVLTNRAGRQELEGRLPARRVEVIAAGDDLLVDELERIGTSLMVVEMPGSLTEVEAQLLQSMPAAQREELARQSRGIDLVGTVLGGKYRIEERLGSGGFGTVFRGTDLGLDVQVAIKVLHPALAARPKSLRAFLEEAQRITGLDHENIVRWITFDRSEEGLHYFVMEYLEGELLEDVLRREAPLDPKRAGHILRQILAALSSAHHRAEGGAVLHLDLKPQNVFLVEGEGGTERVKVIDFGIGQIAESDPDGPPVPGVSPGTETPEGAQSASAIAPPEVTRVAGGTPLYASPEQCRHLRGERRIDTLDGRSDLYSLGVLAFRMLTAEYPFIPGKTAFEVWRQHLEEPVRSPHEVNRRVPGRLSRFVSRLLKKQREERFPDARSAARALDRALGPRIPRPIQTALLTGAAAFGAIQLWSATRPAPELVVRTSIEGLGKADTPLLGAHLLLGADPGSPAVRLKSLDSAALANASSGVELLERKTLGWVPVSDGLVRFDAASGAFELQLAPGVAPDTRWSKDEVKLHWVQGGLATHPFRLSLLPSLDLGRRSLRWWFETPDGTKFLSAESVDATDPSGAEPKRVWVPGVSLVVRMADPYGDLAQVWLDTGVPERSLAELSRPDAEGRRSARIALADLPQRAATTSGNPQPWQLRLHVTDLVGGEDRLQLGSVVGVEQLGALSSRVSHWTWRSFENAERAAQDLPAQEGRDLVVPKAVLEAPGAHALTASIGLSADVVPGTILRFALHTTNAGRDLLHKGQAVLDRADIELGRTEWAIPADRLRLVFDGYSHELELSVTLDATAVLEGPSTGVLQKNFDYPALGIHASPVALGVSRVVAGGSPMQWTQGGAVHYLNAESVVLLLSNLSEHRRRLTVVASWLGAGGGVLGRSEVPMAAPGERAQVSLTRDPGAERGSAGERLVVEAYETRQLQQPLEASAPGVQAIDAPRAQPEFSLEQAVEVCPTLELVRSGLPSTPHSSAYPDLPLLSTAELQVLRFELRSTCAPLVEARVSLVAPDGRRFGPEALAIDAGLARLDMEIWRRAIELEGLYRLVFEAEDSAGNDVRVEEQWVHQAGSPRVTWIEPVTERIGAAWRAGPDGLRRLRLEVLDGNGLTEDGAKYTVRAISGEEPLPTLSGSLTSEGRLFVGDIPFGREWSRRTVELSIRAIDREGQESTTRAELRLGQVFPPYPERLGVVRPGLPRTTSMVLFRAPENGSYVFAEGGRGLDHDVAQRMRELDVPYVLGAAQKAYRARLSQELFGSLEVHVEEFREFFLDEHEVSGSQFETFLRLGWDAESAWTGPLPSAARRAQLVARASELARRDLPMHGVTWFEADAYARFAGKRLPTLLEWEYAVRGGQAYRVFAWEDRSQVGRGGPVSYVPLGPEPWPVTDAAGRYRSAEGLYHLCGNVSEWTSTGIWTSRPARPFRASDDDFLRELILDRLPPSLALEPRFAVAGTSFMEPGYTLEPSGVPPHDFRRVRFVSPDQESPAAREMHIGFRCALDASDELLDESRLRPGGTQSTWFEDRTP